MLPYDTSKNPKVLHVFSHLSSAAAADVFADGTFSLTCPLLLLLLTFLLMALFRMFSLTLGLCHLFS